MCKHSKAISENFNRLGEIAIQAIRKNEELEHYNIIGNLSIEGNRDVIYVSDIETHDVLFMNQNAIKVFGDGVGKKCYEVFHKEKSPCSFCNNNKLKDDLENPINWVLFNQQSKELYYITDISKVIDGRLLRFERATPLNGLTKDIVKIAEKFNLL